MGVQLLIDTDIDTLFCCNGCCYFGNTKHKGTTGVLL